MKSILRRAGKILLKIVGVLCIILLLLGLFMQTSMFKEFLREQIVEATNDALLGRVEIGELDGNLFTGITTRHIKVYDVNQRLAVAIEHAEAHYSLLSLLQSELVITRLELERPTGVMRYDEKGELNLVQIAKPSDAPSDPSASTFGIRVDEIKVRDGRLLYINEPLFKKDAAATASAPSLTALNTLLDSAEELTSETLDQSFRTILRETPDLSADALPVLAMLSSLELESSFTLDAKGVIKVKVDPLSTTLDANSWTGAVGLKSEKVDILYAEDHIKIDTGELALGEDKSGLGPVKLDVSLIPATHENETPYPEKILLDLERLTITKALLDRAAPTLGIQDGFSLKAHVEGTPEALTASLDANMLGTQGKINASASLDNLLATILQDMTLPAGAPARSDAKPSYKATLGLSHIDPSSVMTTLPEADITTTITLDGSGMDPENTLVASAELVLEPSSFMTWRADGARIKADYADKKLTISEGSVRTPYADATLTGTAAWPGQVDLTLTANTGERHTRSVVIPDVGTVAQKLIDLDVTLSATFDLAATDIAQSVTDTRVDATWMIAGLEQPGTLKLGQSKGSMNLTLSETNDPATRAISLALDASALDVETPDASVRGANLRANTTITSPWLPDDVMALRHALLATIDVRVDGVRAAGVSLGLLDANLSISPSSAGGLNYTLAVNTMRNLSYPASKVRVDELNTRLTGRLVLSEDAAPTYIAAQGTGSVRGLVADAEQVEQADFELDVAGEPPLLRGNVNIDAKGLEVGGQSLKRARVGAKVDQNGDFNLTAEAVTNPVIPQDKSGGPDAEPKPEHLKITASGNLSDSLDRVSGLKADIYNLNQDKDEPVWSIADASISTRGGTIQVDNLSLVNGDQAIEINGTYRASGAQDLSVKASNVKLEELREELALTSLLPDIKGNVETIDFSLQGTAKEPELSIDIVIKDFYYEGVGPFNLVLKGRYKNDRLTINTLDLDGYNADLIRGQARVPMSLDLNGNTTFFWNDDILVTFFVDPIDLDALARQFPELAKFNLSGELAGGGILNGTLRTPVLDVNLNAKDINFKGEVANQMITINNLSLTNRVEYEPPSGQQGGFRIDTQLKREDRRIAYINASSPIPLASWMYDTIERGKTVDFATEVSTQEFSLDARFESLQLKEISEMGLTQALKLVGTFDMTATGSGTFEQPSISLATELKDFGVGGSAAGQQIDIRDLQFSSLFSLDGQRGSLDPVMLTADMNWQDHKVLDLNAAMKIPLNGWLTRSTRGEIIDFATEIQTIPFEFDMLIDRFDLSKVAVAPLLKESDAAGVITAAFEMKGTLRDPVGTFDLKVGEITCTSDPSQTKPCNGLGWDRYRDIVIETKVDLRDKLVTLENFLLNWDDLDIAQAQGSLPLPMDTLLDGAPLEDVDYDFTLSMFPVPLNKLSAVDYTFASLTGAMKGKMHLTGSLRKPEARGCFALLDAKLGENRNSVGNIGLDLYSRDQAVVGAMTFCESNDPSRKENNYNDICTLEGSTPPTCATAQTLAYANMAARVNTDVISLTRGGEVLVPSSASRVEQGPLKASDDLFVSVHTRDNQPLSLQNVLPMNILSKFATDIKGTLAIDVDIQGTYDAPIPTGNLALNKGSITLPSLGRRFDEIALIASMDSDTIDLQKLRVAEGDSDVQMKATLNHDKLAPTTVSAEMVARDFNVGAFIDFPFFASGEFALKGDLAATPMDLTIDVNELAIQLTEDIGSNLHPTELEGDIIVLGRNQDGSLMIEGDIASATSELNGGDDIASALHLKTRIKMSRDCWVRHPYGEVNLTGDFTALVDGPNVTMSGDIQAIRGQAEFLGKIFRVERALVTFTGASPPDPRLQIEATYELDQNIVASLGPASDGRPRIIVDISGPSSEPVLKLRSDPTMSETDIIYVLATNRPPGTAGVGQDSSVAAAALSAASGLLVGMLKDELSDNLPLDFFDVLNVDTSNFEVGKYVYNGKIYLSYRYLFGNISGNSSIYQFDYHFFPRWTLEAQGSSGDAGGELNLNVFWDAF